MPESIAFIIDRASKSVAVASTFAATWEWDEVTLTAFTAKRVAVEAQLSLSTQRDAEALAARAELDTALDAAHLTTVQGLTLAKIRHRKGPAMLATFSTLTAKGNSRIKTREEARRFRAWWAEFDAAWVPLPGSTLAAFTTLIGSIEGTDVPSVTPGLVDAYDTANGVARAGAETLNEMALDLEDVNEAWYAAATRIFPAGTAEGDLIRGQVPTTYDPQNPPLPVPGIPQGLGAAPGGAPGEAQVVWVAVPFATYYLATLLDGSGNPLPSPEQVSTNAFALVGLPSGQTVSITITAGNATGQSAPSAPVTVAVP